MIRDLDVVVSNKGELVGVAYLEGAKPGIENRFMQPDRFINAYAYGISGLSGPETVVNFHIKPAIDGVRRVHELIQDEGAITPVLERWGTQMYPDIAQRLALA